MKIRLRRSFALALSALGLTSIAAQSASPGSFSLVGSMSQFRKLHTATLLPNGKVLVAGGAPFAQAATSELYDPTTQTWANSGVLNQGRDFHTATLLADGTVMVAGGQTASRILGGLSFSREGHFGVSLTNGTVLVAGGLDGFSDLVNSSELYDPLGGTWRFAGALNIPRQGATATLLQNGKVLAAGGFGEFTFLSSAELFDPATS